MMKLLLILSLVLAQVPARAGDEHLRIEALSNEVLATRPGALDLDQVKNMVANDSIDVQISYERVVQAQSRIAEARAAYFPYGAVTVAALYLMNAWSPVLLAELVTSLPSKWYQVSAERNIRNAQTYAHKALRENIKTQVATLFYTIKKEETSLRLMNLEIVLMEKLIENYRGRIAMGLSVPWDISVMEQRLLDMKDASLKFSAYLTVAKASFNTMVGRAPEQATGLELAPVTPFLTADSVKMELPTMVATALNRSYEITSAQYMVTAARRARSSAQWSILAFNGIGFGYFSRIRFAESQIDQAILGRDLARGNVSDETYVMEAKYRRGYGHYANEVQVFEDTKVNYLAGMAQYQAGTTGLDNLLELELLYVHDFSEMVVAHYDALIGLDDLERAVLGTVRNPSITVEQVSVVRQVGSRSTILSLRGDFDRRKVRRVQWIVDDAGERAGGNSRSNFRTTLNGVGRDEVLSGAVKIYTRNGEVFTKQFRFE